MDFDKIIDLFKTFIGFIQKLLSNVGVINEGNEGKAEGYASDINGLIDAIKDAFNK